MNRGGSEKLIAYMSRTVANLKKKYSQLEKEGLAVVFCVRKFDHFLRGHDFTMFSDHQPLKHLLTSLQQWLPLESNAWALTLGAYHYTIQHCHRSSMVNGDALSQLPLNESESSVPLREIFTFY